MLGSIVATLQLDVIQFRRGIPGDKRAKKGFDYLRERAEFAGVFVLLIGNLGSHHSNLDVDIFRGFALADPVAPFVVINDQDAETAWSFTLLHELAHIWLGQTGVSGANADLAVEQFCNDVAGRFLLPAQDIAGEAHLATATLNAVISRVGEIANARQVSSSMVAYMLHREGLIDRAMWRELVVIFRQQWRGHRQADKNRDQDRAGGPNYYVVRRHRVGSRLIGLTRRMLAEGGLAPSKAATILGVKSNNVYGMIAVENPRPSGQAA